MFTTTEAAPMDLDALSGMQCAEVVDLVVVEAPLTSGPRSTVARPVYAHEDPATRARVARIMRRALARGHAS